MLKDTGERLIPEYMKPMNFLLLEHVARYQFAIAYTKGRVLDIACGAGYGTQMVAKVTKKVTHEVIGVDISEETIEYARGRYHHPLISYQIMNATDPLLAEKLGTFDTILSFETLEHIPNEKQFLSNLSKMLNPGGTLIISTPFGEGRGIQSKSPFHIHQLTNEEFKELFIDYTEVEFYYQKGVLIEPPRKHLNIKYPIGIAVCKK